MRKQIKIIIEEVFVTTDPEKRKKKINETFLLLIKKSERVDISL